MEIVQNSSELLRFFETAIAASPNQTVLIDRYLEGVEVEVDAVCDGEEILIPGIMQHIERAGVHSGDSMAVYPTQSLTEAEIDTVVDYTRRIGQALGVRGLMNIQFVITGGGAYRGFQDRGRNASNGSDAAPEVFIIEVNPRSSRTIPFISKITRVPMVRLAVDVMRGKSLAEAAAEHGLEPGLAPKRNLVAVKAPVFSMSKLAGVDTFLGPEMKSTGEVMGIDSDFNSAVAKALIASSLELQPASNILLSIADHDKPDAPGLIRELDAAGFQIYATSGTAAMARALGIEPIEVEKRLASEGTTVADIIEDGTVSAVVNTVTGDRQTLQDGFQIRRSAAERRIPCFTSIDTARCAVEALSQEGSTYSIRTLAEYLDD